MTARGMETSRTRTRPWVGAAMLRTFIALKNSRTSESRRQTSFWWLPPSRATPLLIHSRLTAAQWLPPSGGRNALDPARCGVDRLFERRRNGLCASLDLEGMIAARDDVQFRTLEGGHQRPHLRFVAERVSRSLDEQHRQRDLRQVCVTALLRLSGRVEWVTEEHQTANTIDPLRRDV